MHHPDHLIAMLRFAKEDTRESALEMTRVFQRCAGAMRPALGEALEKLPTLQARGARQSMRAAAALVWAPVRGACPSPAVAQGGPRLPSSLSPLSCRQTLEIAINGPTGVRSHRFREVRAPSASSSLSCPPATCRPVRLGLVACALHRNHSPVGLALVASPQALASMLGQHQQSPVAKPPVGVRLTRGDHFLASIGHCAKRDWRTRPCAPSRDCRIASVSCPERWF